MIRKKSKEKIVSAEDDYTDSADPATHDAVRETAPADPVVGYLARMKPILVRDIKDVAKLDTADPCVIILALAGESVYLDAHANLDQIRAMARFLGKHIRIAELEEELAQLRAM